MQHPPIVRSIKGLVVPLIFSTVCLAGWQIAESADGEPLVVFLVRHAEKIDASRDPELSDPGKARANRLSNILRDANIQHIHSSDFVRTRKTAAPIVARQKLELRLYDPADLAALVSTLRTMGGRHLVVGHSTTTPAVVRLLGGQPGPAIDEAGEYDRLYIVTVAADGTAATALIRYGALFRKRD